MGKTTLVETAIDGVEYDPDPVVVRGTPREGPTAPYGPLRQAFEGLPDGGALVARLDEAREADLPDDPDDVDARRRALFDDVADSLREAAARQPVVVFLDNLQWADSATLALFEHFATEVTEWIYPVAFVGTYRTPAVVAGDHPLTDVRDRIEAAANYVEVTLEPLDRSATRTLVEGVVGTRRVPETFVDLVYERTGGVPLFVHETTQNLVD